MNEHVKRSKSKVKAIGKKWEQDFAAVLTYEFYRFSTKQEDMYDHWDVMDIHGNTYDVKGIKGHGVNWLEFMNVRGDKGWMYGKAKYIAFLIQGDWVIVDREELLAWSKTAIPNVPPIDEKKLYTPYRRSKWGRKDIVVMIKDADLIALATKIL